ncbi:MAG: peptidase, partial [Clostridia bacterium]|nr:peptidase [Clostridia bacterium]
MYKDSLFILLIILTLMAAILLFAGNYFYNFSILRRKKEFLSTDPDLKGTSSGAFWDSKKEWLQQQKQLTFTIASYDGLKLHALYLPCPVPSDKTVILIHGYNSWNGSMGGFAQHYLESLGCNVLLPDLRGHGQSEGSYIGFGWHDRKDILQWINLILKETGCDTEIILHGVS